MRELPERLIFTDVETTGLHGFDRVVSIGLVTVDFNASGPAGATCEHLLFNPGRKSSKRAIEVHGWENEILADMPPFSDYAEYLLPAFEDPSIVWAHHAAFDEEFIREEFARAGHRLPRRKFKCTQALWERKRGYPSSLSACCDDLGIRRSGKHSALLDAWIAMMVWCDLNGLAINMFPDEPSHGRVPTNMRVPARCAAA